MVEKLDLATRVLAASLHHFLYVYRVGVGRNFESLDYLLAVYSDSRKIMQVKQVLLNLHLSLVFDGLLKTLLRLVSFLLLVDELLNFSGIVCIAALSLSLLAYSVLDVAIGLVVLTFEKH